MFIKKKITPTRPKNPRPDLSFCVKPIHNDYVCSEINAACLFTLLDLSDISSANRTTLCSEWDMRFIKVDSIRGGQKMNGMAALQFRLNSCEQ